MANNAGIGICGIVVGVILGAGAIIYTQDYSVSAHLVSSVIGQPLAFRGIDTSSFDAREYSKRRIAEKDRTIRTPAKIVDEPRYPRTPERVKQQKIQEEKARRSCAAKLRLIQIIKSYVRQVVPSGSEHQDVARKVDAALQAAGNECLNTTMNIKQPEWQSQRGPSIKRTSNFQVTTPVTEAVRPVPRKRVTQSYPQPVNYRSKKVNNQCDRYGRTTQRYTRCIGAQQEGQRYVGRQTRKYEMK